MKNLVSLIKDKSYLIVCEDSITIKYLIKKFNDVFKNQLVDISYITFNELNKKLNFNNDDTVLLKLLENYSLSYDSAKMYSDNILLTKYLKDRGFNNNKLEKVDKFYEFLNHYNLIKKDDLIDTYLKNKEIIVYGKELDDFQKYLLKDIDYQFVSCLEHARDNVSVDILEFNHIDEEIAYACESVIEKINEGIGKNNIYLVCPCNDYIHPLKRISSLFNLSINIDENINLMSINFVKELVDKYFDGSLTDVDINSFNKEEFDLYKQVIEIINANVKYSDYISYKTLLRKKLSQATKALKRDCEAIEIISIEEALCLSKTDKNAYIYVLGMSQANVPKIFKDEDYYSDLIKSEYGIHNSARKNALNQLVVKEFLVNANHCYLSYAKKSNFSTYIVSSIVNVIDVNIVSRKFNISKYSHKYNKEVYYKKYDEYSKYGIVDEEFRKLNQRYYDFTYGSYNNKYKKINDDLVLDKLDNKLNLSYSSLDLYNKCSFAYYLKYVLGLNSFKGNFMTYVGSVFHYVIEKHFKDKNALFDKLYEEALEDNKSTYDLKVHEVFLMNNLKEELFSILLYLDKQLESINYKDAMYEKQVEVYSNFKYKDREIKTRFNGYIDKLMYKKMIMPDGNEATLVAIVDYKTSNNIKFEIDLVAYGLSLQLPIYAYLAKSINSFDNVIVGGMFIQPILDSSVINSVANLEKYNKKRNDAKRLEGCYNVELNGEAKFSNSNDIIGPSKYYDTETINDMVCKVEEIIDSSFKKIAKAEFDINPKRVDMKNYSCKYCEFLDICYRKESDYIDISIKEEDEDNA